MFQSLIITFREGLEAALIVGIILAYLARMGYRDKFASIWQGVVVAILVSLVAGAILFAAAGELEGRAEQVFEGLAMLTAVGVLSYMVIWMKKQAANIRAHLEADLQSALLKGSALALTLLAFVVVVREGLETALFLFAAVKTSTPFQTLVGGLAGLGTAALVGYLIYRGSHRLNLRLFFNVTGVLIILFAGGLLAYGIHEFQEAGIFPIMVEHVWDTNHILSDQAGLGSLLKGVLGYNGNPSLLEVLSYAIYLVSSFLYFFHMPQLAPKGLVAEKR